MKKILISSFFLLLLGHVNGQFSIKNKSLIEMSFNINPVSRHSISSTKLMEASFEENIKPILGMQLKYKIGLFDKFALGFVYCYSSIDFNKVDTMGDYWYTNSARTGDYMINSNTISTSYGVSVSFYPKDFIAPIGNNISVFIKRNFSNIKNIEHSYSEKSSGGGYVFREENVSIASSYYTVGVGVNRMFFLSSRFPVYFSYGGTIGIVLGRELKFNNEKIEILPNDPFENYKKFLVANEIINLQIGLGVSF